MSILCLYRLLTSVEQVFIGQTPLLSPHRQYQVTDWKPTLYLFLLVYMKDLPLVSVGWVEGHWDTCPDCLLTFFVSGTVQSWVHPETKVVLFCSLAVLGRTPWTYFPHLSLSSVILIDSVTGNPVHVLMLSIQAVGGLPRLHAPGIVLCIISFSRQHFCLIMGVTIVC